MPSYIVSLDDITLILIIFMIIFLAWNFILPTYRFSFSLALVFECLFVCQSVLLPARGRHTGSQSIVVGGIPPRLFICTLFCFPFRWPYISISMLISNLVYFCCRSKCYLLESLIN